MQPTTTIGTTTTLGADAPEDLKDIAKSAIMDLSIEEQKELLERIGELRCLRQKER